MEKNDIRRGIFSLIAILAIISAPVSAHPGRTDGAGGHTNRSTGEYHYHHGYDDHQHYDMNGDGITDCPYNFRDNEIKKSGSSGDVVKSDTDKKSNSSDSVAKSDTDQNVEGKEEKQEENSSPSTKKVIGKILVAIIFGPLVLFVPTCLIAEVCSDVYDLIKKLMKKINRRR